MSIKKSNKKVSIVMGSQSDFKTMKLCKKILEKLKIKHEIKIISAHRTPYRMFQFAKKSEKSNVAVIIAGAGGSAHLPGMIAALTKIPVIGVPISVGYGVSAGGRTALAGMLASCAPGLLVVNIDNGYGAAMAAIRILNTYDMSF